MTGTWRGLSARFSTTHVRRWRAHRGNGGDGHLYQGRYKSFIVATDGHLLTVLRYVEQNALRAGLVQRAEDWSWGSAAGEDGPGPAPDAWPVDRPADWTRRLNGELPAKVLERLRLSGARGRPYGTEGWTARIVKRLGLGHTVRDPWRPKKKGRAKGEGIMGGRVRPDAPVITRSAPGIPPNPGGGIEGVVNPSDFQIDWFHMPD